MDTISRSPESIAPRLAGATYVAASVGFLIVFSWLASHFGYPDVLDLPAADVLPRLLSLGGAGRAVWAVYAVLPLMLISFCVWPKPTKPRAVTYARPLRHSPAKPTWAPLNVLHESKLSLTMKFVPCGTEAFWLLSEVRFSWIDSVSFNRR